ncbi:hypothetical protein BCR44DRAFT_1461038 [Catenaria anguillulae PL171]|uniref:Uncharacterized protein n=1 Tax=Catenaria anguillulae PL171 TaxID=765915 RepID=A0A1Y2HRE7_9FUNG|nr:hypothetical protein BCR44DRAFT_1461038 [Catenaria anguillulae PL171]
MSHSPLTQMWNRFLCLHFSDTRTKSPSVSSNSSDDTFVNRDADHSSTLTRLATKSRTPVNRAFLYDSDDSSSSQEPSARITALPDLPPDLDALSRHDLERLTRLLFAESCRARWVAMSEQEKNKELERKLDKMSAESIRRQRQLLEAVEKQGRELERAKEDAAGLRKRLGQVMSILSTVIPGLAPRTRDC